MQMPAIQGRPPSLPVRRPWPVVAGLTFLAITMIVGAAVPGLRDMAGSVSRLAGHLDADTVQATIRPLGVWSPIVYGAGQAVQVLIPFLPGAPITFAGVLLFGWQAGLALSMAGFMLGSAIQFGAVRRWGRPLAARLAGADVVMRATDRLDPRGWWLLAAFLVPFAPADAFSAVAAMSPISFPRFLVISFLGRLPWAAGAVLLAAGLIGGSTASRVAAGVALIAVAAAGIAYRLRPGCAAEEAASACAASPCPSWLCRLRCPHRPSA